MICRKCGHPNEDGVLFCEQCKEDLDVPLSTAEAHLPSVPVDGPPPAEPIRLLPTDDVVPVLEPVTSEPVVSHYSDTVPLAALETPPIPPVAVLPPVVPEVVVADTAPMPNIAAPVVELLTPTPTTRKPKLVVVRGRRIDATYDLWEGKNYIGRTDEQPVDIDLDEQESPEKIWCSRQHAIIVFENGKLTIEDLKSMNGTFVNRARVHPGEAKELAENDVIQIGTVHMKVVFS
jgi:pSer/pThr/pTyr-binding forkhead associated (FHA) protein